ncbi:MAG TPA: branched-chain amino acid ABC transporter ATP-binding protein/permease [Streptosporangiaceae bacterium]|nr:branched-chain amino acid ABC transporter ATP-binding protein/permease [Streptosporangiaceae bacterium]
MNGIATRLDLGSRGSLRWMVPVVLIILLFIVPQIGGGSAFRLGEYEEVLSFLVIAVALNIAMGYGGQYILGITAVFAVGAYAAILCAKYHPAGIGLVPMCIIGAVAGGIGGLIIGLPALRVGGFYLALVSLFAALAIPTVAQEWGFVGADTGIPLYAVSGFAPKLSGEVLYIIVVAMVLLATLFSWALVHSRVGHRFVALHSSEQLATSIGIRAYRTKLLAILISSAMAGIAGGMYVYTQQFFAPGSSSVQFAVLLLAGMTIGGMGTITGPLIGSIIILGINQFFTSFQQYNGIVFGVLLLAFAIFLPNGLMARINVLNERLGIRRAPGTGARPGTPAAVPATVVPEPTASTAVTEKPAAQLPSWPPVLGSAEESPLVVDGAKRSFGGVTAVDDVDLTIVRGQIHGLIGSNGSGKTTLLNLISRFYTLDAGQIRIGSTRLDNQPSDVVARAGVARTFQSPKLMFGSTALQNVIPAVELRIRCSGAESILRLPRGIRTNRAASAEAAEILEALGLRHVMDRQANLLPHGTRRLVEVARAIAMRPSFILLDEPAAGLSPVELELIAEVCQNLARSGVGVLLIEHNVPMVLSIADTVTCLHQGKRLFQGTPAELRADAAVASVFLGIDEPLEASS